MLIRELSKLTGISAKTIRFYEEKGLLPRPERSANNYRSYSHDTVSRLRFISSARRLGFSVKDITEFLVIRDEATPPCRRALTALDARLAEIDHDIAVLQSMRAMLLHGHDEISKLPDLHTCGIRCNCFLSSPDVPPFQQNQVKGEEME
ncbi:MAG: heavy metal-responsive transcriptional regulator [Anaerolineales bacterium]